jgi:dTDP-4-amino-4,6-dideoxygalactose transaminase
MLRHHCGRDVRELAVHGGQPVRTSPMPGWPHFDDEDVAAVRDVLASGQVNYWTGDQGRAFEVEFASTVGSRHAVAVANGTVALEIALRAIGVGPGDDVIVPAATFIATASAVVTCGARPVVADVDPMTQCLTADSAAQVINERTKAVIVVHLAGHPAAMDPLVTLTRRRGLVLVEDCAQALGAKYRGRNVGTFGDIAAWSFCQDKILTTGGEGGAITTHNERLWRRCWEMKDHGKSHTAVHQRQHRDGFRWLHESFGTNGRMTEMQAAVGRSQLKKLEAWVRQRRSNAEVLIDALRDEPALRVNAPPPECEHAYYKFYTHLRPERLARGWDRNRVVGAIAAEGVPCLHGGCTEIYREVAFRDIAGVPAELPNAARLGRTSLMLLTHPTLSTADMADVAAAVRKVLRKATA